MKKLTNEVLKSYILIIVCFIIAYSFPVIILKKYLIKRSVEQIEVVRNFLEVEFLEPEHQNLDYFLSEVLKESPEIENLYIKIQYHGKTYEDKNTPAITDLVVSDKIQNIDSGKYYAIKTEMNTVGNGEVTVKIIKDMHEELDFINKIKKISIIGFLFVTIFAIYISKNFINKLKPQLKSLENFTNEINLESFDVKINKENYFEEFSNFIDSYENMLIRIEKQAKSQIDFVNNASHELKTPIFIIRGYIDLIKKWGTSNPEIFKESVQAIQDEVKNMSILVEKLLFISNQDSILIQSENINLEEIIDEVITEMNIIYPEQKIEFHRRKLIVNTDWSLLKQVIRNIIDNAIKYGDKKTVEVFLLERGEYIVIKVKDNGLGIEKDDLDNIFNKFYRVDKSHNKSIGGHGLGLTIVKNIVEILNSRIEIKSEVGEGTEVFIILKNRVKD
ncbi:HAMP domain-containing histidine kinase [Cetobacterium sp. 2A]|uniref:sensor histidine kinase n=1 Tax=Cetobacterium sp. 2A TaxID=2754723 RepID=UPI00163CACBE|nr:HAMP domain-containing sensor histidine kinase [Cetobacterium sp. 2A]MBC2856868.1 HAMP domain-containing histidine kinase [Cetobacterium sp. 2A]